MLAYSSGMALLHAMRSIFTHAGRPPGNLVDWIKRMVQGSGGLPARRYSLSTSSPPKAVFPHGLVEHRMNQPAGRDFTLDGVEEADEFAVAVALHAAADDGAVEHAERGEQGGRAVPLVIVGHGLAAPGFDRQSRLGAVGGLNLALFVDRQHDCMGWRLDIEPDNIGELGGKAGVARALEGAQPVRLQFVRCTEPSERPLTLAIARPVQWVASRGGSVQISVTTRAVVSAHARQRSQPHILVVPWPTPPCHGPIWHIPTTL
jgi:hypothetical protein